MPTGRAMKGRTDENQATELWELPKWVCGITLHCYHPQHVVAFTFRVPLRQLLQEHFSPKPERHFLPLIEAMTCLSEWLWSLPALVLCKASVKGIVKEKTRIWEEGIHLTALKCDVSNETFKSGKQSRHSEVLRAVFHSFGQESLRREGFQSLHSFENTHKCNKEIFLSKRTSRKTHGILAGG